MEVSATLFIVGLAAAQAGAAADPGSRAAAGSASPAQPAQATQPGASGAPPGAAPSVTEDEKAKARKKAATNGTSTAPAPSAAPEPASPPAPSAAPSPDAAPVTSPAVAPAAPGTAAAAPASAEAPAPASAEAVAAPASQVVEGPPAQGAQTAQVQVGLATTVPPGQSQLSTAPGKDETTPDPLNPQNQPMPGGLSVSVGTQLSVGSSLYPFVANEYVRNEIVNWGISFVPAYMFSDSTRVSASASLSQELTLSDSDDDPQTFIFGDIGLNVSRRLYQFENGPGIGGQISVQLPTSDASRTDTLITSVGARLNAMQNLGKFNVSLSSGFRKNFHEYTTSVRDPNTGRSLVTRDGLVIEDMVTGIARIGGSELAGATYFDGEALNTSMILSNGLSVSYMATDRLNFALSYNLSHSWTYESFELDEFSGVGATEGRGRRDSHGGGLSVSYQLLDNVGFGAGMNTGGPTRTADDKRIRFPFYAFEGAASNMTTFFISATYTEAIGL